jgi:hypothetical protein
MTSIVGRNESDIYETSAPPTLNIDLYSMTLTVLAAATIAMPIMHNHPFVDM